MNSATVLPTSDTTAFERSDIDQRSRSCHMVHTGVRRTRKQSYWFTLSVRIFRGRETPCFHKTFESYFFVKTSKYRETQQQVSVASERKNIREAFKLELSVSDTTRAREFVSDRLGQRFSTSGRPPELGSKHYLRWVAKAFLTTYPLYYFNYIIILISEKNSRNRLMVKRWKVKSILIIQFIQYLIMDERT